MIKFLLISDQHSDIRFTLDCSPPLYQGYEGEEVEEYPDDILNRQNRAS
jgi:hypothetical protein